MTAIRSLIDTRSDAFRRNSERMAERLAQALSEPFTLDGLALQIGASVGIALYPEHGTDPESLMASADQAMYLAKAGQRDCGSLVPPRSSVRDPG